jgi:hypothetical protein
VGIRNFKPTLRKAAEWLEAIEAYLAMHAGVSPEAIDEFDRAYQAKRKAGDDSEPGDVLRRPIANNARSARRNAPRPVGYASCKSSPSLRERVPTPRSQSGGRRVRCSGSNY